MDDIIRHTPSHLATLSTMCSVKRLRVKDKRVAFSNLRKIGVESDGESLLFTNLGLTVGEFCTFDMISCESDEKK